MPQLSPYFTCSRAYLIGVQNYLHLPTLSTPIKDVEDLSVCLLEHEFSPENISVSRDSTKTAIENLVAKMLQETGPRDRVICYFAGHGIAREESDEPGGFLIPVDAERNNPKSFIEMRWLLQQLAALKCKHLLLILDCCFAGAIRRAEPYRTLAFDLTKKLYREKFDRYVDDGSIVRQVLTSSSNEEALDKLLNIGARDGGGTNSPFADILLNLLKGNIQTPHHFEDGIITTTRMYDHIDQALDKFREEHQLKKMQSPYYFPLRQNIRGQFIFLLPQKGETVITSLPHREIKNPYKGLSSFETKDSHLFFGRKSAVAELKALYSLKKVILISGASGVGKSSLIQAGFIPAIHIETFTIRPGNIRGTKDYLETCAVKIKTAKGEFLLFADQFEEMVTICTETEKTAIHKFILANLANPLCKVIISIRSDFESQLKDNELIRLTQNSRFVVPPFSRDEIEDIIVQPAYQAVIQIESDENTEEENDKFINKIVDEVMQSPGSLPLLSFALQEWYIQSVKEGDNEWALKECYYKGIGGVSGALSTIIEKFSDNLKTDLEMECLKKLLLRMVSVKDGQPARKKVYAYELQFDSKEQTAVIQNLLNKLIELRIISTNPPNGNRQQKTYYEPVHDSLLTSWGQLWQWINMAGLLRMSAYQQLAVDTKEWKGTSKNRSNILWGERQELQTIRREFEDQDWADNWRSKIFPSLTYGKYPALIESEHHMFNTDESAFIRRSIRRMYKKKSLFNNIALLIPLLMTIVILSLVRTLSKERGSRAYALTTMAEDVKGTDNMQALRIMQKAFDLTTPDSIMHRKMEQIWKRRGFNPFYTGPYLTAAISFKHDISPSGKHVIFTGSDTMAVFEFSSQRVINKLEELGTGWGDIYFNPANDSILIVSDNSNRLTLWNFITDTIIFQKTFPHEFIRVTVIDNNILIDSGQEIIWMRLPSLQARSYFRPRNWKSNATIDIAGFPGKDKLYYLTSEWLHIVSWDSDKKDSIRSEEGLISAKVSNTHILLKSKKSISLYHLNGKFITTLYAGKTDDVIAAFSPDGQHILLEGENSFTTFKASFWNTDGMCINDYNYPSAKFSATGKYIMLLKWKKEDNHYVQFKQLEKLNGAVVDSSNGLLLSDNDQYLVTIPQLKVTDLKTGNITTIKINHGITADSIKENRGLTSAVYAGISQNIYTPLDVVYAGTLLLTATKDSKYLIIEQHYKDSILENKMNMRKLNIYNFSTKKQLELLEGPETGNYSYIPGSQLFFYNYSDLFQYWDLNYLSNFTHNSKFKNAHDIHNYLDTSRLFPPLESKYEKF